MPDQEQLDDFIEALEGLGGRSGNGSLRERLAWDEATYNEVKAELVGKGILVSGRGRGGSVALTDAPEPEPMAANGGDATAGPRPAKGRKPAGNGAGPIGFEAQLWKAADALRNKGTSKNCNQASHEDFPDIIGTDKMPT